MKLPHSDFARPILKVYAKLDYLTDHHTCAYSHEGTSWGVADLYALLPHGTYDNGLFTIDLAAAKKAACPITKKKVKVLQNRAFAWLSVPARPVLTILPIFGDFPS